MDRGLDLAAVGRVAAAGRRVIGALERNNLPGVVFHRFATRDEIGVAQAHFGARRKPEELLRRVLHEILALDVELAREADAAGARRGAGPVGAGPAAPPPLLPAL